MNRKKRVCMYYSEGPHFVRVLKIARETYLNAEITAMLPPDYPASEEIGALTDCIVETERAHFSPRDMAACLRLLRQIRGAAFDVFIVMFDSNQLRLLASLSGASECLHGTIDGRLAPLPRSVAATLGGILLRTAWGHFVYAVVWLVVHLLPVRVEHRK